MTETETTDVSTPETSTDATKSKLIELDLVNDEGRSYTGSFTGRMLVELDDCDLYEHEDGRILAHDRKHETVHSVDDVHELREWLTTDEYIEAMDALDETPIVDL